MPQSARRFRPLIEPAICDEGPLIPRKRPSILLAGFPPISFARLRF
jgi:hypothetical protein